jgi:hypothetical protein
LADILAAADAIEAHLKRGGIEDGLVFDAVRVRLIEVGEAVKAIDRHCWPMSRIFPGSMLLGCVIISRTVISILLTVSCWPPLPRICRLSWRR